MILFLVIRVMQRNIFMSHLNVTLVNVGCIEDKERESGSSHSRVYINVL